MKLSDFFAQTARNLAEAELQCADSQLHAKQILEAVLEKSTAQLYLEWERDLSGDELSQLNQVVERRCLGEPFQYIVGYEWFWKHKFEVGPGVLIPRRETEFIVETLLEQETRANVSLAELGVGSGNIGISVLAERPHWNWHGYELSEQAYAFAKRNINNILGSDSNYDLCLGDFFEMGTQQFDWIVSNPPYVSSEEMEGLAPEIHHEPALALDGGPAGLSVLSRLIEASGELLKPQGQIILEISPEQKEPLVRLLENHSFIDIKVVRDYAGGDRIVWARRR